MRPNIIVHTPFVLKNTCMSYIFTNLCAFILKWMDWSPLSRDVARISISKQLEKTYLALIKKMKMETFIDFNACHDN